MAKVKCIMIDRIEYTVRNYGWADMTLKAHTGEEVSMTAEYMREPFADLLLTMRKLLKCETQVAVIEIDMGSRCWELVLSVMMPGLLRIEVLEDACFMTLDSNDDRVPLPVFTAYDYESNISSKVYDAGNSILKDPGSEKYEEMWGSPFPLAELDALKEAIQDNMNKREHQNQNKQSA